jgi:hypothetical protein
MTNDPKKWWIDYLNERNLILRNQEGHAKHVDVYEFLAEARSRFKEEVIKALGGNKWCAQERSGGKNTCITCNESGVGGSECVNAIVQKDIETINKL